MRRLVTSSAFLLSTLALSAQFALAAPPVISKGFDATSILLNGTTVLRFFISTGSSQTSVAFTDNLPAGLVVASPNSLSNSCGGTLTATPGSASISLTGGATTEFPPFVGIFGCNISLSVTGTTGGTKVNITGNVSSTEGGMGNTATATLIVGSPSPSIFKSFGAAAIALNGSTSLSFTIGIGLGSQTGLAFTDTLPAGLVVATPNGLINTCNGTLTAVTGSNSISLTGGSIPGFTFACSVQVAVKGTTAGTKVNITGNVSSTEGGTGNTATATVTVNAPPPAPLPVIAKSFNDTSIFLNGTTRLILGVQTGSIPQTGISFVDNLPSGLVVATPNGLFNSCNGTVTAVPGSSSISLTGGNTTNFGCSVQLDVKGTTAGTKVNITGNVSSTEGGPGNTATASINVVGPPSISKAFGAGSVSVGGTTSLTFTINNPNPAGQLINLQFTDTLPTGLLVATPNGLSNTCGGTATATTGGTSVSLLNVTLAGNGTCTLTVNVLGSTNGVKNNVTSNVAAVDPGSTLGVSGNAATATLVVATPPSISKSFALSVFPINTNTTLSFTLTNTNTIALTGANFTDALPTGIVVANPVVQSNTCGGTLTAAPAATSISLTGGTIPANGTCTVTVTVTGTSAGVKNNVTSVIGSVEGGNGNTAAASTIVALPPTISKAFGVAVLPLNGVTTLTFSIANPNATTALSGVTFLDPLPAGLLVSNPNGLINTCGGVVTALPGTAAISLAGGNLAISGTCTITVNVTGSAPGNMTNTTNAITSTEGGTGLTATANIVVGGNFLITYAANLTAGDSVLNLTNTGANGAALLGPGFGSATGNICMNVYGFSPDEQLVSCCSCLVTPNGLVSLSIKNDIVNNTLTGVRPNSVVVKVIPTGASANFTGTSCTNAAAVAGNAANPLIASGGLGFSTTIHAQGAGFGTTENPMRPGTLSAQELASITNRCTNIIGNGSTFGICGSCRAGGLNQ